MVMGMTKWIVNTFLDNFYNLPFYSNDDTHNLLQVINDMDQSISIYISKDIQFKWR